MKTTQAKILTALAAATTMTGAALSLTGCAFIDKMATTSAKVWAVTYELSTDSAENVTVSNTTYRDTPSRAEGQVIAKPGLLDVSTEGWRTETLGVVTKELSISATPPEGVRLTCKILLDGTEQIATATSAAPGEAVRCAVKAPEFPG